MLIKLALTRVDRLKIKACANPVKLQARTPGIASEGAPADSGFEACVVRRLTSWHHPTGPYVGCWCRCLVLVS